MYSWMMFDQSFFYLLLDLCIDALSSIKNICFILESYFWSYSL